jgi:hypothetical protein
LKSVFKIDLKSLNLFETRFATNSPNIFISMFFYLLN